MPLALSAAQTRTIRERIAAVNNGMLNLQTIVLSGQFNFYGSVPSLRLIVPMTGKPGERRYELRQRLRSLIHHVEDIRRLTSAATIGHIAKLTSEGYTFVKDIEEAKEILMGNGEME